MTHRNLRFGLLGLALVAGAAVYFLFLNDTPESLFQRAIRLKHVDPRRSQDLLLQSIAAADGQYPQAQLALAENLISEGRCLEALGSFGAIKDLDQCVPDELNQVARQALNARCLLLASLSAQAASRHQGEHQAEAFALLTQIKADQQEFVDAAEASVQWSELEPDNVNAWYTRGQLHQRLLKLLHAAEAFRTAIALQPKTDQAIRIRESLLSVLLDIGELPEARYQLEAIKEKQGLSETLALSEAKLLHLEGNLEAAKRSVEKLIERCETVCLEAYYLRGLICFDLSEYESCIQDFQKVIAQQPYNKEAHFKLGRALLSTNQPELAKQHLEFSQRLTKSISESLKTGDVPQ